MATIAVIGDGPAGLSAALFLAKNGHSVIVFGDDTTPMHHALLHNYLGIDEVTGTDFQRRARAQVERFGAELRTAQVMGIVREGSRFTVTTQDGAETDADYVVLAAAKRGTPLARALDVEVPAAGAAAGSDYRVADRLYAVGRLARLDRSQAIISAGAGAVAALDILAHEAGHDVTDWETADE